MGIETFRASYDAQQVIKHPEILKKYRSKTDFYNDAVVQFGKHVLEDEKEPQKESNSKKRQRVVIEV